MSNSREWWGDAESKPAPEPLARVQALVNTLESERGRDRLVVLDEGAQWLIRHDLADPATPVTEDDLRAARGVREALRAMVLQNTDGTVPDSALVASLHAVADGTSMRATIDDAGRVNVVPAGSTVRDRLAGLLLVVQAAQRDGTWSHLKACANEECRWAFYDRSRNHGGTWCDMASCGNKLKNRDFRARKRAGG